MAKAASLSAGRSGEVFIDSLLLPLTKRLLPLCILQVGGSAVAASSEGEAERGRWATGGAQAASGGV